MKRGKTGLQNVLLAILMLTAIGCQSEKRIVIISTNDMHAAIERFPNLAGLVETYRATDSARVLLVDAGDRWTGNPYVDLAARQGAPIIELANALHYDIATFGNHEFDRGMDTLAARMNEATFEKILTNADMSHTNIRSVKPYTFRDIEGIRIGFLGLVTTAVDGHPDGKIENMEGVLFTDPYEAAEHHKGLRDSCDLFVAITHIGNQEDSLLAVQMPELDLIIGGHSHTVVPVGRKVNRTVVTQTGKSLRYAGITTITLKGHQVKNIDNRLVQLDTIAPSPRFQTMVDRYREEPSLNRAIGSTTKAMNRTALLNFFSDIMREGTGADIAFYNLGSLRIESLPAGDITVADVFAAEPFSNSPVMIEMTPEEIQELILRKFNSTGKESHTLDIYPSGMSYTILTDDMGNGTEVILDLPAPHSGNLYKVAMSDYMDSAYDFPKRGTGVSTGKLITTLVTEHLDQHSPIHSSDEMRVKID